MHMFINLRKQAEKSEDGEIVFGADHTGSHACYMIYGILQPGEQDRLIKPGHGHEEMVLATNATLRVTGAVTGDLNPGDAFHITEDHTAFLENPGESEAVYVIAGGHSEHGHGH